MMTLPPSSAAPTTTAVFAPPAKSSLKNARTASICVGLGHPTVRFFVRRDGGTPLSTLRVDVRFGLATGKVVTLPVGLIAAGTKWQATLPGVVVANLLPLLPGERTAIEFRLVPQGSATWYVDDVLVDPWRNR